MSEPFKILSPKRFEEIVASFSKIDPIVILGDIGIDKYTYGHVRRISPEAPVPVLEVEKQWMKLGLAANVADNLQFLKIPSVLLGVLGDDHDAGIFEDLLKKNHLSQVGILKQRSYRTIVKERIITDTQQICRIDFECKVQIEEPLRERLCREIKGSIGGRSALIIEDYAKGLITPGLCSELIGLYGGEGNFVAVDPGRDISPLTYKGASLLKPNLSEAVLMVKSLGYHTSDLEQICEILMDKLDLSMLVITLGRRGMILFDPKGKHSRIKRIPTVSTEVFDVSGAGDTSLAILVSSLMTGASLEESVWIANSGAAVVVGKQGTALVSLEELKGSYEKLYEFYGRDGSYGDDDLKGWELE